jgi:hypothetical protein
MNRTSTAKAEHPSGPVSPYHPDAGKFPPVTAFAALEKVIRNEPPESPTPSAGLKSRLRKSSKKLVTPDEPLVILGFDEAHTTTELRSQPQSEWSNFGQLRRALRSLNQSPLFSLFLSTTGKISQFASARDKDLSARIVAGILVLIQPYTDLGFDQLARKIAHNGTFTLEGITSDDHIAHYGRPMYVFLGEIL